MFASIFLFRTTGTATCTRLQSVRLPSSVVQYSIADAYDSYAFDSSA